MEDNNVFCFEEYIRDKENEYIQNNMVAVCTGKPSLMKKLTKDFKEIGYSDDGSMETGTKYEPDFLCRTGDPYTVTTYKINKSERRNIFYVNRSLINKKEVKDIFSKNIMKIMRGSYLHYKELDEAEIEELKYREALEVCDNYYLQNDDDDDHWDEEVFGDFSGWDPLG